MKCPVLLLWCWLLTSAVLGKPFSPPDDTTRAPNWLREQHRALSLPALPVTAHRAHFRFSTEPYVVEGWREDHGGFVGQLVLWTKEASPGEEAPTHRVHRVAAQMDGRNVASAKLARRVGMQHEAHLRQDWWSKGEWTDTVIFGMVASDRA